MKKKIGVYLGTLLVIGTLISPPFHGYLLFFFMNGLVLVNAVIIYHNLGTSSRYVDDILGISVIALSQITVTQLYPGLFGYLSLTQVVLTQIGCLGLTLIAVWIGWMRFPDWQACLTRGQMAIQEAAGVCSNHAVGVIACVVAGFTFMFVFAVSALNPPISIDSIFFHLMQAVYWLQTGYIPIKLETYFAYPHGNPLVYLWGLYPFHHDFIARFTQIPFILLGALASYGICRILDMSRTLSLVTALAVLTMPAYLANGIALTDPDTQMAGACLVSLYFALSLARSYRFSTIILLALALGQLLSAKYNSVYYGVPLVLLIIYAWAMGLKKERGTRFVSFVGHGVLLFIIPISVGGVTYVYEFFLSQTMYPFDGTYSSRGTLPPFNLWLFFTSPQSLKDIGVTGLLSLFVLFGILKNVIRENGRGLILPVFILLPLCFSLGIYALYGYYEGAQAIRHLLGTLALCIILAGWSVHHLNERWRRYGLWGLVLFIVINAGLGVWRQWFIHLPHTDLLSLLAGILTSLGIWWLLRNWRQTGTWPIEFRRYAVSLPGLLGLMCIGLWSLHGWEWAYRDMKYARWPPKFGYGTGWGFVGELTTRQGARITYNTAPYPIFGYDLKNTLVHVMPNISSLQSPETTRSELVKWEVAIQQQDIDLVYLLAIGRDARGRVDNVEWRFDTITEWMQSRPAVYKPVFTGGRESVFIFREYNE